LTTDNQLLAEQSEKRRGFFDRAGSSVFAVARSYHFDAERWANKVRAWSAEFKSHPKSRLGSSFRAHREIRTL